MSMDFKDHVLHILENIEAFPEEMRPTMKLAAHAAEVAYCSALVEIIRNRQAHNMQTIQMMVMDKCATQVANAVCEYDGESPDGLQDVYVRVAELAEETARKSCQTLNMVREASDAIN